MHKPIDESAPSPRAGESTTECDCPCACGSVAVDGEDIPLPDAHAKVMATAYPSVFYDIGGGDQL